MQSHYWSVAISVCTCRMLRLLTFRICFQSCCAVICLPLLSPYIQQADPTPHLICKAAGVARAREVLQVCPAQQDGGSLSHGRVLDVHIPPGALQRSLGGTKDSCARPARTLPEGCCSAAGWALQAPFAVKNLSPVSTRISFEGLVERRCLGSSCSPQMLRRPQQRPSHHVAAAKRHWQTCLGGWHPLANMQQGQDAAATVEQGVFADGGAGQVHSLRLWCLRGH